MINTDRLKENFRAVREKSPLVHNITNYVAMNFSANALLAAGASPVMAHAADEVADMAMIAGALVINIGTLDAEWVASMLKAGHMSGDSLVDYFYNAEDDSMTKLQSNRVQTRNTHGTGYTLSSAFAASLAKGENLTDAAISAKRHIEQAIISGAEYEIGKGHGPVNHGFDPVKMSGNEI